MYKVNAILIKISILLRSHKIIPEFIYRNNQMRTAKKTFPPKISESGLGSTDIKVFYKATKKN